MCFGVEGPGPCTAGAGGEVLGGDGAQRAGRFWDAAWRKRAVQKRVTGALDLQGCDEWRVASQKLGSRVGGWCPAAPGSAGTPTMATPTGAGTNKNGHYVTGGTCSPARSHRCKTSRGTALSHAPSGRQRQAAGSCFRSRRGIEDIPLKKAIPKISPHLEK